MPVEPFLRLAPYCAPFLLWPRAHVFRMHPAELPISRVLPLETPPFDQRRPLSPLYGDSCHVDPFPLASAEKSWAVQGVWLPGCLRVWLQVWLQSGVVQARVQEPGPVEVIP